MALSKKRLALLGLAALLLLALLLAFRPRERFRPFSRPFSDLEAGDIMEVWIEFGGFPAYPLDQEDLPPLVDALRAVELFEEADYHGYDGLGYLWYRLELSDGESLHFQPANPFFITGGTGFRTKYQPCDTLGNIGYGYVDRIHAANPEMSKPHLFPPFPNADS